MPEIAVIVISYNSLSATTQPCLESIFRASASVPFKLVVVDNASIDSTRDYLNTLAERRSDVKVLLNPRNLGFAAANNAGIRSLDADYYILLNSDTIVTDGWLDRLVGFLAANPEVGVAGPVSNSVGTNQMIHVNSANEEDALSEGLAWAKACRGDFFFTDMLAFFCVAIRREALERIGFLDEGFGLGMYEDDDFCHRTMLAGFKLACLEDVFIYHKGSVCFGKIRSTDLTRLVRRNRRYYEQKHRVVWQTRFTPALFLNQIDSYLLRHRDEPERLVFKVANKVSVLRGFSYAPAYAEPKLITRRLATAVGRACLELWSAVTRLLRKQNC